ncbi:MAG: ABC transporter permease, partial [Firmicutes bacterium]|nr:ABC transporter permease [Bacillota bacterium]
MARYVAFRLGYCFLVVLGVSLLVFVITHLVGSPVDIMLPLQATDEEREQLEHQLGLDRPLWVQLGDFTRGLLRLDFGLSWWQKEPALRIVLERMPATFQLVMLAFLVAASISIPLGILAAYRPGSTLDRILTAGALTGICLPTFWVGLMLVTVFAVRLGWFYTSGYGTLRHLVLPVLALSIVPAGRIAQVMRFSMLDQLSRQYVTTARAKGLDEKTVIFKHALKNAAPAVLTTIGVDLGRMLAGISSPVEHVFAWPGFGTLILDTIQHQDFPLLQACVFVVAIIVTMINLLTDLSYAL